MLAFSNTLPLNTISKVHKYMDKEVSQYNGISQ